MLPVRVVLCAVAVVVLFPMSASAQAAAGVSDERVKLPSAPGSIDGVGENATVEGNQGALRYDVAIEVPQGFPGVTPQLSFSYSSLAGAGPLGIGWSMPSFSIERMTSRGLQKYALDDRFAVDGAQELVRVAENGASATYRARFEGGFIRYTWRDRGTGGAGSWVAEYPDGRVGYYGADAAGVADTLAQVRVPSTTNVFRWQLTKLVDRFGHELNLTWSKDASGTPLLERMDYLYEGTTPKYSVRLTWEARLDSLSDARPGFDLRLTKRVKDVRVFSGAAVIRAYVLTYEADGVSGGASRLARIARFGRNDLAHPVTFDFGYSRTLGGVCDATCQKPFVRDTGTLGVSFATGTSTLIDINGDALPDVLSSDTTGAHRFYYGRLDSEGLLSFDTTPVASAKTMGGSPFKLGDPAVQVIDVNGDGFVDIIQPKIPTVLCNTGTGDWADASACTTGAGTAISLTLSDDTGDATQADPLFIRFFDYDNDRRIDFLRTVSTTTTDVLVNTPSGFVAATVDPIGAVFDSDPLQLADMNGDGLQDPVRITTGTTVTVSYRLNLGYGKWGAWVDVTPTGLDATTAGRTELQDLNGDGLADLVAVVGNEVKIALNRNGERFDTVQTIATTSLASGAIPSRLMDTVVTYADMNGNGSDDVVWIQANGQLSYLELFPVRPNLISRIENGVGAVQLVTYGTSIHEQARDAAAGRAWPHKVPNATSVVTQTVDYVTLTGTDTGGLRELNEYRYHDGFYDGAEKQFRGYASVERVLGPTAAQEGGRFVTEYDVGATDPVLASELLVERMISAVNDAPLRENRYTREACPVTDAPATVRFSCQRAQTTVLLERDPSKALTLRTEQDWDGFGNVTHVRALGVVNRGTPEAPMACDACTASGVFGQACGADCTGDERYTDTEYVTPGTATGGLWLAGAVSKVTSGAVAAMAAEETRYFYDGPEFVGLAQGQLTRGSVTRVARRSGPGASDFLDVERYKRDPHGNVAESLEATATVADATRGRRVYTYDATGLNVTQIELRVGGADVASLRRDLAYEASFGLLSQSSNWYPVVGGAPVATPQQTRYRYDDHGRISAIASPGDSSTTPGLEVSYELASPASRIVSLERSSSTSGQDVALARCLDGRGRIYQVRTKVSATLWQVDGLKEFDERGAIVRQFQGWTSSQSACEATAPMGTLATRYQYDALGRLLKVTNPDNTERRTEYAPLVTRVFDEGDTDTASPSFNTPTTEVRDGQLRVVAVQRLLEAQGTPAVTRVEYDERGDLKTLRDAAGHVRTQTYDALGRLVRVDDTNGGTTTRTFDAAGNLVTSTDAAGNVVQRSYDPLNRLVAQWSTADEAGTKRTWTWDRLAGCTECTNAGDSLVKVTWPTGEDRFGYDAKGNRVYKQRTQGGHAFIVREAYDGADRLVSTVYPGGLSVERTYDAAGRFTGVPGVISEITYDARGQRASMRLQNGVTTRWTYDASQELASITSTGKDGAPFLQLALARRSDGTLSAIDDGALAGRVRHAATITSDAWARPTRAELPRTGDAEVLTFTFDAIDNLLSQASSLGAASRGHLGSLSYDATRPNAVTQAGELAVSYDAAGRVSGRGAVALTRDHLGRVTGATGGAVDGSFSWGTDERVARSEGGFETLTIDDDFEVRDGIAVAYVSLGDERLARLETDALAPAVLSDLTSDGTVDISDAWLAQAAGQGLATVTGTPSDVGALLASATRRLLVEDLTWLHRDHLGSLVAATDATGAVRGEQSFYPTGAVREASGFVDERGFTGQLQDRSTGLLHFAQRELDPSTGRWDQPDPYFFEVDEAALEHQGQVLSGYGYVANRYFDLVDPDGQLGWKNGDKGMAARQRPQAGQHRQRARFEDARRRVAAKKEGERSARPQAGGGEPTGGGASPGGGPQEDSFKPKGALAKLGHKVYPYAARVEKGTGPAADKAKNKIATRNGAKVLGIIAVALAVVGGIAGAAVAMGATSGGGQGSGGGSSPPAPDQLMSTSFTMGGR